MVFSVQWNFYISELTTVLIAGLSTPSYKGCVKYNQEGGSCNISSLKAYGV